MKRVVVALLMVARAGAISGPLVTSERWPESTDLPAWTRDVMRIEGLTAATETAQGKALFRWLRLFNRMATGGMIQAFEGEAGRERYVTDAHKNLFVYGWGYCDTTSRIAEAAWVQFKRDRNAAERVCVQHDNGGYHTMYRLRMDGRWGAFDGRYGYYLVDRDAPGAAVLDWADVGDDSRILANQKFTHRSAPFFEFFGVEWQRALLLHPKYFATEAEWIKAGSPAEHVFGNRMYEAGTRYHSMDFHLPRGSEIERFWDNSARKFYVPRGTHTRKEEAFLPSGRYYRVTETMFDGNWPKNDPNYKLAQPYLSTVPKDEGYNAAVAGGRTIGQAWGRITLNPVVTAGGVFDYASPYILVDGTVRGELRPGARLSIRTLQAKASSTAEPDRWSEWKPVRATPAPIEVNGVYRFQLRVEGAVRGLRLELNFENGIMSLPRIFAGANTIHFKVRDASLIRGPIRVAYRYQTAAGERRHEQVLRRSDFHANVATYRIDAPGLERCNSISVRY